MKANTTPATMAACFMGCVVQAIVNNFAPLLFATFSSFYQLSLSRITLFITFNFLIQIGIGLILLPSFYCWGSAAMVLLSDYSGLVRATIPERESY